MNSNHVMVRVVFPGLIAVAFAAGQFGCRDTPTAPAAGAVPISETINAPGDSAAPETIFLAPLGPRTHPRGELDTTLAPSVAICRLSGDVCGADTVARFRFDSTKDSVTRSEADSAHLIVLSASAFHFRWHIADVTPDTAIAYRVTVTVGDTTVGFTDLKIVDAAHAPTPDDTVRFAFIPAGRWLRVRFQIYVPRVSLTVITEPGVHGDLASGNHTFRRGERVPYSFVADSGYGNALVTLDQNPIGRHGSMRMDGSHVLIASADRNADVAPGDEWIVRDARAVLKARDKVTSAQQLLDRLDSIPDTVNLVDRLRRVEAAVLRRDGDAAAMQDLDAAMGGHSFDAGSGDGFREDRPGGDAGGGGGVIASALLIPLNPSPTLLPSASVMTQVKRTTQVTRGGEPVTIAYVNGILTTPLGALFAAHHVATAARSAQWYVNAPFDVKLIYNRSAMAAETSAEDRCVLSLGITGDWLGLNSLPRELARCLNTTEPRVLEMLADYAEAGNELVSVLNRSAATRPRDVDTVAAFARRMQSEGRHLIFVMHSQGNLVVQQALTLLRTRGQYSQSRDTTCMAGVALASPTSEAWPISARHLHGLVVDGDAILMLGKNNFPRVHTPMSDSAVSETTGSIRARIVSLATAARIRWGLRLHSVIQSYLSQAPMRARIQDAMVSSYRGCALGDVRVTPQSMELKTGGVGAFHVAFLDLNGDALDGRRGTVWDAESQSDWQRSVSLSDAGVATAHYVGGTSLTASTRSLVGNAGVVVDAAPLDVAATENLSARWAVVFMGEAPTEPQPIFVIPGVTWDGGSCTEKATFESNGRTGTFSKQCTADYRVTSGSFPSATKYQASFFQKGGTSSLFTVSGSGPSLRGTVTGPSATLDLLPGPLLLDRIAVTAIDGLGHLLATGVVCVHGCVGW